MSLQSNLIGRKVIARSRNSGVLAGTLEAKDGQEVRLTGAHRLWRWFGGLELSQIAETGVKKGSRIGVQVPEIELTEVCEVMPMTDAAFASLEQFVERV